MQANLAALEVLRRVQSEDRAATPAEHAVLARWGSWGAVPGVFDETKSEWETTRGRLHALLSEHEYMAARRTTVNAHYTDATFATAMWDALADLGVTGGHVLEPGCGAGTFLGTAPPGVQMTGVELDPVTAAIACTLYPGHQIRAESFAATRLPRASFNAAIGNVPFADVRLVDAVHNPTGESMHNHFIIKSLDLVKPGGAVVVLTSSFTMDARNPSARTLIAERADLLGAVRLPTGAHRRAAGTDAVTDLLVLRRREDGRAPVDDSWVRTALVDVDGEQARIGGWFAEHPEMVLGDLDLGHGMYGAQTLTVRPRTEQDTPALVREALSRVVDHARAEGLLAAPAENAGPAPVFAAPSTRWDGHIERTEEDTFVTTRHGVVEPLDVPASQHAELAALVDLRTRVVDLLTAEAAAGDEVPELEEMRAGLNGAYDAYVEKYGPLSRVKVIARTPDPETGEARYTRRQPAVMRVFRSDPFAATVFALEHYDEASGIAAKADILHERVVVPRVPAAGADTPTDALALCLDRVGRVDLEIVGELLGVEGADARTLLGDLVYADPEADGLLVPAPEYLSGNVRAKLDIAKGAADQDPDYAPNVAALEAVQPAPIAPGDIEAKMGAVWIPVSVHEQFLSEVLDQPVTVKSPGQGIWEVHLRDRYSVSATSTWGTGERHAGKIAEAVLEQRVLIVRNHHADGTTTVNPVATTAAQEKCEAMRGEFADWVWRDPARTAMLAERYNRQFNSHVLRDFTDEGKALSLPGLAASFTPHPHQRTAVARMIHDPAVGLFHEVGAGKTAEMVMGAMELRRLGLVTKPVVVVPNHMLAQFTSEWIQLYPQARLLAASSADLAGEGRRTFVARAATNDWDAIVMTRGSFGRISLSPDTEADYLTAQIEMTRKAWAAAEEMDASPSTVKQLEKSIMRAEERHKKLRSMPKDPGLDFEATGIDYVIVDEAHDYKNLATASAIQGAAIAGSQRATDLHMKLEWLRSTHGERVGTLATGTPLTNSITEAYVMQRYMRPDVLTDAGIETFDQWAATFGQTVTELEIAPQGGGAFKINTRFAKFQNARELLTMWGTFADVKTAADLELPRPDIAVNTAGERAPENVVVAPGEDLTAYMQILADRVDQISARMVDPHEDNMLAVSTDGRKAAMDMRLIAPGSVPDNPKANVVADRVAAIWQAHADDTYTGEDGELSPVRGSLQLVFCDFSAPRADGWNMYDELKAQFVDRGVPASQIRFIHQAATDAAKARLFAEARAGQVAVLLGSTAKMGTGTNVQDRIVAMHHIDCPWRPADVTQREGRGIRQGNQNSEVAIYRYLTEQSFDAYMWQTVERKAAAVNTIMRRQWDVREVEDIGDAALSAGAAKAAAAGDPLVLEHATARQEVARLQRMQAAHHRNQTGLLARVDSARTALDAATARLPLLEAAHTRTTSTAGERFAGEFAGSPCTKRPDAQALLVAAIEGARTARAHRMLPADLGTIARLGGHELTATIRPDGANHCDWIDVQIAGLPHSLLSIKHTDIQTEPGSYGLVARLENHIAGIPDRIASTQEQIARSRKTLAEAEPMLGAPFAREMELEAAKTKLADVETAMATSTSTAQSEVRLQTHTDLATIRSRLMGRRPEAREPDPRRPESAIEVERQRGGPVR